MLACSSLVNPLSTAKMSTVINFLRYNFELIKITFFKEVKVNLSTVVFSHERIVRHDTVRGESVRRGKMSAVEIS